MSIDAVIVDKVARGMLFPLVPKAAGATIRRAMFVGEALWGALNSPEGDDEWEERIGKLRADLEVFVVEEFISPKYLFLLYKASDGVWEIRSVQDAPSIRVLGHFALKDVFISTNFALRETLGGWQSRAWKEVKRAAKAVWRNLFNQYAYMVTTNAGDVISGATNEQYYKDRS
jgi:hypothetical protein